jgi:hypothetical protein
MYHAVCAIVLSRQTTQGRNIPSKDLVKDVTKPRFFENRHFQELEKHYHFMGRW